MIPRRVYNPPIRPSSNENCLKGPLPDWDSPSSHTGTVKRRPPSLDEAFANVLSTIDIDGCTIDDIRENVENSGTTIASNITNNTATTIGAVATATEGFEINKRNERTKISLQEIVPGNCNPNEKEEKGNEPLEQNRNYLTNANSVGNDGSGGGEGNSTSMQQRKSRLKLPSQLSVSGKYVAANAKDVVPITTSEHEHETKQQFGLKQANGVAKAASYGSSVAGRQANGPKHPQVMKLKEGLIAQQQQHQQHQQHQQQSHHEATRGNVAVTTAVDIKSRIHDNNNKSIELHKNKSKHATTDDTSKKYFLNKLPQANKLKFQDSTAAVFTELYRDFPVNYASTTVVESIPLKPPPYCNPPPAPSPSTLPPYKQQQSNCSSIETAPHKIKSDNKSENAQVVGIANQPMEKQHQPLADGRKTNEKADVTNVSATKSDCTTAHRIANELRLKGNFALQKLTNISKLNHKNSRFFMSSSSKTSATDANASSTAKKINDESSNGTTTTTTLNTATTAITDTTATASASNSTHIKDENDKDVTRENLNDYILFNPIRQQNNGVFIKMGAKKSPPCDILAKPEFSSSLFKNIPVRPRKGVPHLENYCLFDPSKDFVNEKEVKRLEALAAATAHNTFIMAGTEYIHEVIYEDQLVYDTLEDESPSANYFTIDPDYLEKSPAISAPNATLERHSQQIENIEKIIDDFLSSSGNGSNKIELVHTIDKAQQTCSSRAILKNSPQIDRLFRQTSLPVTTRRATSMPPSHCDDESLVNNTGRKSNNQRPAEVYQTARDTKEIRQSRFSQKTNLKQSISMPQLQSLTDLMLATKSIRENISATEHNYALFNPVAGPGRSIQYKIRHGRPLSTHSDADSGFLSPVTPPEGPNGTTTEPAPTIVVLQQCDSIQGYIEVCVDFSFVALFILVWCNLSLAIQNKAY